VVQDKPSKQRTSKQRKLGRTAALSLTMGALGGIALGAAIDIIDPQLPDVGKLTSFHRAQTITIMALDGQIIQQQGPISRDRIPSGQVPQLLKQAFVASEDRRFYEHGGIDGWGVARALLSNAQQLGIREGASTITQQLARIVFLTQERTLVRKVKEALLALKLERQLNKEQILHQYINNVYLGSNAYGAADAAWVYFSKRPEQLTLPEAALIAGLPPAPSVYSPLVNADLAKQQRQSVLRSMREMGFITREEEQQANGTSLNLKPTEPKHFASAAPYFTEWVDRQLPTILSLDQIERGGLNIRTTLNLAWQRHARQVLQEHRPGAEIQGALVAMDPVTGQVRAMVGGQSFYDSQFNRATQALRSPGSTFKLFVYTAALREGLNPNTLFIDAPTCFGQYCPRNFGNKYFGAITMKDALRRSVNTVAVQAMARIGFGPVVETARALGIEGELGHYWPMALGAYEQTLLGMTTAYAAVNNRGVYVSPTPFLTITGPDGEELWSLEGDQQPGRQALDAQVADTMMWMLQDVVRAGTGIAAQLPDQRPVAGKTGTSQRNRDLWFIGSIPQLTTGVWYGYDDERDTGHLSGEAAWTWKQFMVPIAATLSKQNFPPLPGAMAQRMRQQQLRTLRNRNLPQINQEPPPTTPPADKDQSSDSLVPEPQGPLVDPREGNGDGGHSDAADQGATLLQPLPPPLVESQPPTSDLESGQLNLGDPPLFRLNSLN